MLGVVTNPCDGPVEQVMRRAAEDLGVGDTFRRTPVGVFFGPPGERVPDPYFGGDGPERTGCTQCGNCMVGCRVGAKNTLVKNYLALAERRGRDGRAAAHRDRGATGRPGPAGAGLPRHDRVRPGRGCARTGARSRRRRWCWPAAPGAPSGCCTRMRVRGGLPHLSPRLGHLTRTNSEALGGAMTVRAPEGVDLTRGVAITSSFHPDADTHVENCRYGRGSNAMGLLATILVPGDGRVPRPLRFAGEVVRRPVAFARSLSVHRWSERTVIGLVMQSLDNSLVVSPRRGPLGGVRLTSRQGHGEPNPTWIPAGHRALRRLAVRLAERTGVPATPGGSLGEVLNVPMTAHFLGGAVIGATREHGVVDAYHRVWGYPGLHVVDGSAVSANLGVNPALTITAQAERAMSLWPAAGEPDRRPGQGAAYERLDPVPQPG